jgi:hypothetical protein
LIDGGNPATRHRVMERIQVLRREDFFEIIRGEAVIASKLLWSLVHVLSGRLRDANDALPTAHAPSPNIFGSA